MTIVLTTAIGTTSATNLTIAAAANTTHNTYYNHDPDCVTNAPDRGDVAAIPATTTVVQCTTIDFNRKWRISLRSSNNLRRASAEFPTSPRGTIAT